MLKHVGSNWTVSLLQVAVMLVLTPYIVGRLGEDPYGVWVAIVSLVGFLDLLALGVPMASVRHIAERAARGDRDGENRAISTSLGISLGLLVCSLVAGAALYPAFERALLTSERWSGLTAETASAARIAYAVVTLQVAASLALRLPLAIYDAHHDFVAKNAVLAGGLLLRLVLVLVLLAWHASLIVLAAVQVTAMLAEFVAALAVLARRQPQVRFRLASFDPLLVRPIVGFGVFATLLNVGTMLAYRLDALVIGTHLAGAANITDYDMGNKFFEPLAQLVIGIGAVVMPVAVRYRASGRAEELRDVVLRWSKLSLLLVGCIGVYLLVLGPAFLGRWVGPRYEQVSGPVLQVLMLSFLAYLPVRATLVPLLLGSANPAVPALGLLAMGALNLALSLALVRPLGILGVALGTAIPNVLFAAFVLVLACRRIEVPPARFLAYTAARPLAVILISTGLLAALEHGLAPHSWAGLVGAGILHVALFGTLAVGWVLRGDPLVDLAGRWRGRRPPGGER